MLSKPQDQSETTTSDVGTLEKTINETRSSVRDRFILFKKKRPPLVPVVQSCFYLLILFLGIQSYFYGSLFRSSARTSNLHILAIDYDRGLIGASLRAAYEHLRGPDFLTLEFQNPSNFPDLSHLNNTVCGDRYWGTLYTQQGASDRFHAAVTGELNGSYNPSDAVIFIYNGVRYPVIGEAYLTQDIAELTAAATQALHAQAGQQLLSAVKSNNPASMQALFQPLDIRKVVQNPVPQGAVILLNSFTMIIPPLMQFFYVMALDHISLATRTFSCSRPLHTYVARLVGSTMFSFIGALSVTGCIWAFRESWHVTGLQFFETWFVFWFYMCISYLVVDSFIGTIVPMKFAPFFIFSFIILNVTSTLYPFELDPGFYRWAYALPAHAVWLLLMEVWSNGCVTKLDVALPVLFTWWVVGHCTSAFAVWRKCRAAQTG